MSKSAILDLLILVAMLSATPLLAQSGDSSSVTKPSTGRTWTMTELDTLSSHKWVWRDPSFKEVVLQIPDSLPDKLPYLKKKAKYEFPAQTHEGPAKVDVVVRVLIDKKGKERAAYIQMDSGLEDMGFEETALAIANASLWEPAYLHYKPVTSWITYFCRFRLVTAPIGDPVGSRWEWIVIDEESSIQTAAGTHDEAAANTEAASDSTRDSVLEELPKVIRLRPAMYPETAGASGIQSSVWVEVLIGKYGKVMCAMIKTPSELPRSGFDESALTAALWGEWKPAIQNGKPILVWVSYEILFRVKSH